MKILHIADPDLPNSKTYVETTPSPHLVCAADHPAQPVEWLWPGRIPLGKVTLLAGDPGLGKSLLALDLAARVTRALPFPETPTNFASSATTNTTNPPNHPACVFATSNSDLPPSPLPLPPSQLPGSVLILSASDTLSDTIRPRLDAAGADPDRVFLLPAIQDLRHDFGKLREAVESLPDCRLIIIDPISAYVGPSDAHFHTVVRRVLEPLAALATRKSLAILAITHLNKSDGAAIQRAAGSMGFVSSARTIWTLARDHQDPTRTLLFPLKNNLAPTTCGLAFTITTTPISPSHLNPEPRTLNPPFAPRLLWDPNPVTISPREALRSKPLTPRQPTQREEAREFLREALADGPRPAQELLAAGDEHGFHRRTIQRAFHDLAGHTAKQGWTAGWWWALGDYPAILEPHLEHVPPNAVPEVTYAHDVAFQNKLDKLHRETLASVTATPNKTLSPSAPVSPSINSRTRSPLKPPTVEQSIAYFNHKPHPK